MKEFKDFEYKRPDLEATKEELKKEIEIISDFLTAKEWANTASFLQVSGALDQDLN